MKNYVSTHDTHHTPGIFFLVWLENVVILIYNKCSKLTLIQKIEEPLITRVSKLIKQFENNKSDSIF